MLRSSRNIIRPRGQQKFCLNYPGKQTLKDEAVHSLLDHFNFSCRLRRRCEWSSDWSRPKLILAHLPTQPQAPTLTTIYTATGIYPTVVEKFPFLY